jgi:hypothetical protein
MKHAHRTRKPNAHERALMAEWERTVKSHSAPLDRGAKAKGVKCAKPQTAEPLIPPSGYSTVEPSRVSVETFQRKFVGSVAPRQSTQYTGTEMLGVSTMHKSNSTPVFSKEAAIDIARMRRG